MDVETTGGSFGRGHRVVEVAVMCVRGDGRHLGEYATLVDPCRYIPRFITRLTGISNELVRGSPLFGDVALELRGMLDGRIFVAHNMWFDWGFLRGEFGLGDGAVHEPGMLCTLRLARRLVPELRSRSLASLTEHFGIENLASHRAYGDTRATAALLRLLLERAAARGIESWADLQAMLNSRRRARPALVRGEA